MEYQHELIVTWLSSCSGRLKERWKQAKAETKLYLAGAAIVFTGILLGSMAAAGPVVIGGATLLAIGFAAEAYQRVMSWLETGWGKLVGALLAATSIPAALGLAGNIVNQATGQHPENFPYAVAALAPMTAGYFIVLAASLVGFLYLCFATIELAFVTMKSRVKSQPYELEREAGNVFLRLMAAGCLMSITAGSWNGAHTWYETGLRNVAQNAAFVLDTYSRDTCQGSSSERIKRVNDDFVIVAQRQEGQVTFSLRACPWKLPSV